MFFDSIEIDNPAEPVAVTFDVGTKNPNVYVSQSIDFKNGAFDIGDHHLYIVKEATATRTNGFLLTHKGGKGTMSREFRPICPLAAGTAPPGSSTRTSRGPRISSR